jgi:hypothetical protein
MELSKAKIGFCVPILAVAAALPLGCGGDTSASSAGIETGPLRVSARGIAPYREAGGDNSIEEYGREASSVELKQAAKAVHDYLVARVGKSWMAACSLSSPYLRHHVKVVYEFTHPGKPRSCPAMFKALAPGEPPIADTRRKSTEVDADSLRVEGTTGFLFFDAKTEGRKLIMVRVGTKWMPAGLLPTPLH